MPDLTADERSILELEQRHYRYAGAKEQAIRVELGLTSTRYYQVLNRLLDDPPAGAVAEFGPLLARLRRVRDARVGQRAAQRRRSA